MPRTAERSSRPGPASANRRRACSPSCSSSLTTRLPGGRISHHDQTDADDDRLIFLADAVTLVPFSETTLRRAIARGELQAWQPNRDGKLVMWRSALIEWATRRPATDREESETHRERRLAGASSRRERRNARPTQAPDPISLLDLA